jgi:tight adherence protein B
MLDAQLINLAVIVMSMLCAGGVAWVFVYPLLSGERRTEKRMQSVRSATSRAQKLAGIKAEQDAQKRRKQVQDTLKGLEQKQKKRNRKSLRVRIEQAGLSWSVQTYVVVSIFLALVFAAGGFVAGMSPLIAVALALVGGLGLPHWLLSFLKKRRMKKFLEEFANAVDVVVRGVKAGLPLNDCIRVVAGEVQEPVKTEFRRIIEAQAMGLPLADCVDRMYDRMPLAEVNFFAIVVSIQQKAGGNLSEALSNLSRVLRERKKMQGKIRAMSQEAKASAAIIGALPIFVMVLVFLTSPDYIALLWTEPLGHIMLAGSAAWMLMGVFVMRKMINFDF